MSCAHCGAALPDGALFCGECGRSVMGTARIAAATTVPRPPTVPLVAPPPEPDPVPELSVPGDPLADAEPAQSAEPVDPASPVAGSQPEMTFSVWSPEARPPGSWALSDEHPDEWTEPPTAAPDVRAEPDAADAPPPAEPEAPSGPPASDVAPARTCPHCGAVVGAEDRVCPNCGFLVAARPVELPAELIPPTAARSVPPGDDPDRLLAARWDSLPLEDLEITRIVAETLPGERYVLQFSTGESVAVRGSGLVGRNPAPEPGEYVDQLVPLFDAGKSVSKTHLEFGQENGRFWVSDRYSTNGTVVRGPDVAARRCEPGRRYLVSRGTRVDIGEQFFVVS